MHENTQIGIDGLTQDTEYRQWSDFQRSVQEQSKENFYKINYHDRRKSAFSLTLFFQNVPYIPIWTLQQRRS